MIEIETYNNTNEIKIPVNNKRHLKMEFIKTTNKENNQYLKISPLDNKGNKEKSIYINEGDLVLLYNLYIYKKENNEEIF